jgi:hypothetical protein
MKKKTKKSENKQLLELGQKQRAGQLISSYLRAIGTEVTEIADVFTDPDTGRKKIISKAEALARDIWEQGLKNEDEDIKLKYRKLLLERIEGKPGTEEELKDRELSIPDQISELNRDKLNAIAEEPAKEKD